MREVRLDFVISENNDRIRGMLWGLLVGDCLGSPAQFMDMDSFPRITEMIPCHYFHTPPGYLTDDGAMALCIMESAVDCNGYDLEDIADCFISWYDEGFCSSLDYAFDIGTATAKGILGWFSMEILYAIRTLWSTDNRDYRFYLCCELFHEVSSYDF